MFAPRYTVFEKEVCCAVVQQASAFKRESSVYKALTELAQEKGWRRFRIETKDQQGFPDMLFVRRGEYWLVEAKMLHKARLVYVEDDLVWQFGQLAFMNRALHYGNPYALVVAKGRSLACIVGGPDDVACYPDFIERG